MTKKEIAQSIADRTGIPLSLVKEIVQMVLKGIIDVLTTEGRFELRNFGILKVKRRKARQGHNPRTGELVQMPETMAVTFKPGREMALRVRDLQELPSGA